MDFLEKAKQLLTENADKVEQVIQKAGDIIDEKTQGKYTDTVNTVQTKVQEVAKSVIGKGNQQ